MTTVSRRGSRGWALGARAHPCWGGVSPFKMHYSITFEHQSNIGRPSPGEILHPPLVSALCLAIAFQGHCRVPGAVSGRDRVQSTTNTRRLGTRGLASSQVYCESESHGEEAVLVFSKVRCWVGGGAGAVRQVLSMAVLRVTSDI